MNEENKEVEEVTDPQYAKGFNNGYLISKYEPELSDQLLVSLQTVKPAEENMYHEGLKFGMLEHEIEKSKEQFKDITKINPSSPDKSHGIEKTK